jgi:HEPN domain-containing protein
MRIEEKINYWIDLAEYDLETAKAMHNTKRYLYVGFMCHQVIEKILKGYYWKILQQEPPYIHNLSILAKQADLFDKLSEEQKNFLDYLEPLNIRSRYPGDKSDLISFLTDEKMSGYYCKNGGYA